MKANDPLDLIADLFRQQILWTSAHYDLSDKKERIRSVTELEHYFIRLCNVLQPDIFIEAGAHNAALSGRMRRYLKSARIVAFEANPENYENFKNARHIREHDIEYVNKALSDSEGTMTFNVIDDGRGHADKQGSLITRAEDTASRAIEVDALRMDSYISSDGGSIAAWIDVEGASGQVLQGMSDLFLNIDVVFIEVEDRAYWEGQMLANDVTRLFLRNGFRPIARDYQSRYQHNMIFLSENAVSNDLVQQVMSERASMVGRQITKP